VWNWFRLIVLSQPRMGCVMRMMLAVSCWLLVAGFAGHAETNVVNGMTIVCEDGVCRMIDAPAREARAVRNDRNASASGAPSTRLAQGYMDAEAFVAFLENRQPEDFFAGKGIWLIVLLALLGGLAMNLTPCVLPMIPINLMIIGKSAVRGAWYGLGIMIAYGVLGVLASVGGMAFGSIQSSPWFNLAVALVFVALALSLFGVFFIDFSKRRGRLGAAVPAKMGWGAFLMGMLAAVLAGACVAPILIAVLLLTARLFAAGNVFALGLPFVLGLGMALPWPFVGAGLAILPKPGLWMKWVNRGFGIIVLGFAAWYGRLAFEGFERLRSCEVAEPSGGIEATPATLNSKLATLNFESAKPILVDCWATWCKNCAAMEKGTLADPKVRAAMENFTVIRLQAEDMGELRELPGFEGVMGLPAFVILDIPGKR